MKRGLRLEELYQSFNQYNVHGDFNAAGSIKHLRQITRELARGSSNRNRGHVGGAARHNSHAGAASRVSWVAATRNTSDAAEAGWGHGGDGGEVGRATGHHGHAGAASGVSGVAATGDSSRSRTAAGMRWVATSGDLGWRRAATWVSRVTSTRNLGGLRAASRVSWVAASRDLGRSRAAAGMRWVTSTGNFSWGRAAARVSRIAAQTSGNLSGSLGTASRMGWVATTRDLGGRRTFRCYCSVGSGEKKDGRQTSELHFDGRKRL